MCQSDIITLSVGTGAQGTPHPAMQRGERQFSMVDHLRLGTDNVTVLQREDAGTGRKDSGERVQGSLPIRPQHTLIQADEADECA